MRTQKMLDKIRQQKIERVKATMNAADGVISAHFAGHLKQLAHHGRLSTAYALMMLGYNVLRQYLEPDAAQQNFISWCRLAVSDTTTKSTVSAAPEDYSALTDAKRFGVLRKAAQDIVFEHFAKQCSVSCSRTEAAYALIVLAFKLIRQDQPDRTAKAIFDFLRPFVIKQVDASRTRHLMLN